MDKPQGHIYYPPQSSDVLPGRQGCVTLYGLVFLALVLMVAVSYISATGDTLLSRLQGTRQIGSILLGVTAIVILFQVIGLWLMKRWGLILSGLAFLLVIANFVAFWLLGPNYPLIDSNNQWRWAQENMLVLIAMQVVFGLFLLWATRWVLRQRKRFT
ncbi:MAG: hypothetical protein K8L99_17145 [Anaerolineae bacterium]|nr:hypothetical protein [Anaerolineae bacterium]